MGRCTRYFHLLNNYEYKLYYLRYLIFRWHPASHFSLLLTVRYN